MSKRFTTKTWLTLRWGKLGHNHEIWKMPLPPRTVSRGQSPAGKVRDHWATKCRPNGCIYITLLSKVLHNLVLIHPLIHQQIQGAAQFAIWGLVSCPRTLWHMDRRSLTFTRDSKYNIQRQNICIHVPYMLVSYFHFSIAISWKTKAVSLDLNVFLNNKYLDFCFHFSYHWLLWRYSNPRKMSTRNLSERLQRWLIRWLQSTWWLIFTMYCMFIIRVRRVISLLCLRMEVFNVVYVFTDTEIYLFSECTSCKMLNSSVLIVYCMFATTTQTC